MVNGKLLRSFRRTPLTPPESVVKIPPDKRLRAAEAAAIAAHSAGEELRGCVLDVGYHKRTDGEKAQGDTSIAEGGEMVVDGRPYMRVVILKIISIETAQRDSRLTKIPVRVVAPPGEFPFRCSALRRIDGATSRV